ncbi:hypothetical protein [Roseibium sp.]|uniref:hypothetical protein n=1 Tax=Roseibium sp. TaxID=1936156 RepID=UPI0032658F30
MQLVQPREDLTNRQRDYLLLTIFVLTRHGYYDRALILVESMLALEDYGAEVRLAHVVLKFLEKDFVGALADLDHLESLTLSGGLSSRTLVMRRYLRARCFFETGRRQEGEAIARALAAK